MKRIGTHICVIAVLFLGLARSTSAQSGEKIIVHLELKGPISEAPVDDPFGFIGKKRFTTKTLLDRLRKIRDDSNVDAVYITLDNVSMGLAQVQELREAFQELKHVDKEVYIHSDSIYSTGLYWLLCSATEVAVVPTGDVWLTGLYGEQLYLKDLLTNLHLDADIIHIGDYKSAGELLSRNGPSEPAAEMMNWLFDDIYRQMLEEIGDSRSMDPSRVESLINKGPYSAEQAIKRGLIDAVAYRMDFVKHIKERHGDLPFEKKYGQDGGLDVDLSGNPFTAFTELFNELMAGPSKDTTPSVAVIYVAGTIVPGEGDGGMFGGYNHGASSNLRKTLYEAAHDDSVKAVVLRVDSPGGSAVASEIIHHATQEVASRKPFIVSMGNVAASGGYWVSSGAERIFAEPGTITGSIGVVGAKIVTKGMWDWMGVHWHPIQRGDNADIMATDQPWTEAQREQIRSWMESIYAEFYRRVLAKREDKLAKPLDELAGGRVYTGAQAKQLGLVDELGGLQDAVTYAALEAKLGEDYKVKVLPKPKTIIDMLMEDLGMEARAQAAAGQFPALAQQLLPLLETAEPMKARALMRMLEQIRLMQTENVLTVMPFEVVFR